MKNVSVVNNEVATIICTKGKTDIDLADLITVAKFSNGTWCINESRNDDYAHIRNGKDKQYLHRLIMKEELSKNPNLVVDHIDGCKRNNKRSNLQLITHKANCQKAELKNNTRSQSGYRKVYSTGVDGVWRVIVKDEYLGCFTSLWLANIAAINKRNELNTERLQRAAA